MSFNLYNYYIMLQSILHRSHRRIITSVQSVCNIGSKRHHVSNNLIHNPYVLTEECLDFLANLHNKFSNKHAIVLQNRKQRLLNGSFKYRADTMHICDGDWSIDELPEELKRRHVELTGPVNDAAMVINALNSNKRDGKTIPIGYMMDLEDSMSPTYKNVLTGHHNIIKAVRRELTAEKTRNGHTKHYSIMDGKLPTLHVRTRGLHMFESNLTDSVGTPMSASLFDLGVHLFHNGKYLHENGMGPNIYFPKIEQYSDALFLNKVLEYIQTQLNLPKGSVKLTCLIETLPAIFQTEEIAHALRDNIVGFNCGRWDYFASMLKNLPDMPFPDRNTLSMDRGFAEAYVRRIVQSCHKRGMSAMGGMSNKVLTNNPNKNVKIMETVKPDKITELERGCDGFWVAHTNMVFPLNELASQHLNTDNQIHFKHTIETPVPTIEDLINIYVDEEGNNMENSYTMKVARDNISVSMQYIAAWLSGNGCVKLNGAMEDLATVEISLQQLRQWVRLETVLQDNENEIQFDKEVFTKILFEIYAKLVKSSEVSYASKYFPIATKILEEYVLTENKVDFLGDIANKYDKIDTFKPYQFDIKIVNTLKGSGLSGLELSKYRANYLKQHLSESGNCYKFMGVTNGVLGTNVVAAGRGRVGPYLGGWDTNAMNNRLLRTLPDTLWVSPEEPGKGAEVVNNHLETAYQVHMHRLRTEPNYNKNPNYLDTSMLADMEQGWNSPAKLRLAIQIGLQNGITVFHIEDQGPDKKCGHMGGKGLDTREHYEMMLRTANLAITELMGHNHNIIVCARTDAYSADCILNNTLIYDKTHPDHKYVDWKRGATEDGKYLYLKKDVGLELAIDRTADVYQKGLATRLWMETPTPDLDVAHSYSNGVNEKLAQHGMIAKFLYNNSMSFRWWLRFIMNADPLAHKMSAYLQGFKKDMKDIQNGPLIVTNFLEKYGSELDGDMMLDTDSIKKINCALNDSFLLLSERNKKRGEFVNFINKNNNVSSFAYDISQILNAPPKDPIEIIKETIAENRLKQFVPKLQEFNYDMHLMTLPDFPFMAQGFHNLAERFDKDGMHGFVMDIERIGDEMDKNNDTYTHKPHQTATGTGLEGYFNGLVGSIDTQALSGSTETEDKQL
jgi:malate synthase